MVHLAMTYAVGLFSLFCRVSVARQTDTREAEW